MVVLLIFAFLSGLVTIAAPCIWPLLPIILSSSAQGGHRKPLGITVGIMSSFAIFTLTISYIVSIIPLDLDLLRMFAVGIIAFFGFTLLIPQLNQIVEGVVSRLSGRLGGLTHREGTGFTSGFITGLALGLVWTPCAGPILATIATLAATQAVNFQIVLVTIVYVIGVGIPLFLFALL
ncbi:MAG: cytochrome c biogenesis protein CcdA, partial [Microgenomates group bacterium]